MNPFKEQKYNSIQEDDEEIFYTDTNNSKNIQVVPHPDGNQITNVSFLGFSIVFFNPILQTVFTISFA